jgi:hypothetical protein
MSPASNGRIVERQKAGAADDGAGVTSMPLGGRGSQ